MYILFRLLKIKHISKEESIKIINKMIELGWRCSTELYTEILGAIGKL